MTKVIQIRDVTDRVHAALVEAAEAEGLSLTGYLQRGLTWLADRPAIARHNMDHLRRSGRHRSTTGQQRHQRGADRGARRTVTVIDTGAIVKLIIRRRPATHLLDRMWELRHDLSGYDATYVALAESLDVALITTDRQLARAPGLRCEVAVV